MYLSPKDGYDPTLYSHEESVDRLINLFNNFLHQEKRYLENAIT
ncbi:DUF2247 family protein [Halobacillus hunanensis]